MKFFRIFLFACVLATLSACGGRYYYAKNYTFDCSTQQLLDAIDSLKAVYPHYNIMYNRNGVDSLVNADDNEDPFGQFVYRDFKLVKDGDTIFFSTAINIVSLKDTISKYDIMHDAWAARRYYGCLRFTTVFINEKPFNHGKGINTDDLTREENKYYIKLFEDSIVNKIKKRRFSYFL